MVEQFQHITASYEPYLFHCYEVAELEHLFGSVRYHERRAAGRKTVPASLVVQGAARLPARS